MQTAHKDMEKNILMTDDRRIVCLGDTNVGDYNLTKCIGRGSFSSVFLGTDEHGKEVAVKITHKHSFHLSEKEYAMLADLNHENIIRVIMPACMKTENYTFLVMEFHPRGDAYKNRLAVQADPALRENLTKDLLKAGEYLTEQGIASVDVKPDNILITINDRGVLTDLNCAESAASGLSGKHEGKFYVGTRPYRSFKCILKIPTTPTHVMNWAIAATILFFGAGDDVFYGDDEANTLFLIEQYLEPRHGHVPKYIFEMSSRFSKCNKVSDMGPIYVRGTPKRDWMSAVDLAVIDHLMSWDDEEHMSLRDFIPIVDETFEKMKIKKVENIVDSKE
jgi:serine/threonine protein kinase